MVESIVESARGLFCDTTEGEVIVAEDTGAYLRLEFAADWHSEWTLQWLTAVAPETKGHLDCADYPQPFRYVITGGQVFIASGEIIYGSLRPAALSAGVAGSVHLAAA